MNEEKEQESWIVELLRSHPAVLVSAVYFVASMIGMLFSWDYLRLFGINVFKTRRLVTFF